MKGNTEEVDENENANKHAAIGIINSIKMSTYIRRSYGYFITAWLWQRPVFVYKIPLSRIDPTFVSPYIKSAWSDKWLHWPSSGGMDGIVYGVIFE